eukprot:gene12139-14066_t
MNDLLKLASADGLELVDRSECVNESGSGDWSESESGDWSECADGLEAGMDESEGEKSSGADESEKSQSADELEAEGSPSDGMDGSEDEDSEDMDGSKASIDESEREKSSNADESEQSQSADELEAEGCSPSDGMDGSQDEFEREKFSNADESELLQSADELEAEGSPSDGMDGSQDEQSKDMDGLKPSTDESEREKSSNADDSEQSQSADELEAEGSPSDGIDGSEDEDSEDMDGSEPSMEEMVVNFHCMDESEGEESSNADESMLSESADELEAEGSPSDGMDGSEDEDSEDMDGSEPSMEEMMVDFESEQDSMKSSMNKWYDGVEVIDLTGVDDGNLPVPQITTARKKEDYVWAGEADANDVVEIEKMLLRGSGQGESSEERTPNVNGDARKYLEHYNGKTQMWICAVCGSEEGECDLKLLEDIPPAVFAQSDMSALFTRAVSSAVGDNTFHQAFVNSIRAEFHPTGLLKSAKHVCKICLKQLRREKFVQVGSNGVDECADDVENDESDDEEEDDEVSEHEEEIGTSSASPLNVPTAAYLQGLYPGVIPPELADLRTVELSMVSIYNPITRLQLNCKGVTYKYFHGKANAYTIVNDVTNVASVLPQLPNVQTLAILRYTNDVCTKDLKYRPGMVKRALEWLKRNNHLYKDIVVQYPEDWSSVNDTHEVEPDSLVMDEEEKEVFVHSDDDTEEDEKDGSVDGSCNDEAENCDET